MRSEQISQDGPCHLFISNCRICNQHLLFVDKPETFGKKNCLIERLLIKIKEISYYQLPKNSICLKPVAIISEANLNKRSSILHCFSKNLVIIIGVKKGKIWRVWPKIRLKITFGKWLDIHKKISMVN